MLTIFGGVAELRIFCSAIRPPKVVRVSAQEASTMAADGAAALAHSASRMASPSSALVPGLVQLEPGCSWVKLPAV